MTSTQVIWCDFGGVLTDPVAGVLARVAAVCAVPPDTLMNAIHAVAAEFGGDGIAPLETGALDEAEWGRRVAARLSPTWRPRADLCRFSDLWYADRTFNADLYDALVRRGRRLAMLTNSVREWEPHRAALMPDQSRFETVIRSHEHGVRKPDPEIFRLAERALGVPAAGCLLIDDSDTNCHAAIGAGWRAVRHRSNARTLHELDLALLPSE